MCNVPISLDKVVYDIRHPQSGIPQSGMIMIITYNMCNIYLVEYITGFVGVRVLLEGVRVVLEGAIYNVYINIYSINTKYLNIISPGMGE